MPTVDCDLAIVGSGFGGAVCALRAAEAGLRVILLERGNRMTPEAFEELAAGRMPTFHSRKGPGLIDLHRRSRLLAACASAVGGGSQIYTAVTLPAPREVFERDWPAGLDREALQPYYDRVAEVIAPSHVPVTLSRTAALETLGRRIGATVTRLPLAMDWPDDVTHLLAAPLTGGLHEEMAVWFRGGRAARKRTLAQTYLPRAEALGVDVRPLHEVETVSPREAGGYRVACRFLRNGNWGECLIRTPRVVLAAGTLSTVWLLLHCRDSLGTLPNLSDTLGTRFFTNGDSGGLLVGPNPEPTPDSGPPVTAWVDLWDRHRLYLMETGLVPYDAGSLVGLLNPANWLRGNRLVPARRCTWSIGTMGYDPNPCTLRLGRLGGLINRQSPHRDDAFRQQAAACLRELAKAAGAKLIVPPAVISRRLPVTIHPLGGAGMAESPDRGVTDPFGEVYGYPGLYVADGSLLPTPTGVPPSMTIAALAEYVAENLVK
ncbi:MAG: FAD-dependent oxidoreductase, partial [Planctomycetota bacterium]